MSDDIVKRLRNPDQNYGHGEFPTRNEAADEIERLRALAAPPVVAGKLDGLPAQLREYTAIRYMGDCKCGNCRLVPRDVVDKAADALAAMQARIAALEEALESIISYGAALPAAQIASAALKGGEG